MQSKAASPDEYVSEIPDDKREAFTRLRETILENLPKGYVEEMSYGMIGYVVPFSIYPKGYHCKDTLPLPFMNLAAQKNFIALHHMGIYAHEPLLNWFTDQYPLHSKLKLDMGKGCIRFKKVDQIPYALIAELVRKMEVAEWVNLYESTYRKNK
ncbi:MAG TPA: DUF1801 domain-containing protein [Prolixibacteraceae bacterium]|jgi:hypothetical protein